LSATLHLLCAGAARGLAQALLPRLAAEGLGVEATYGAVGALRDRLADGAPCDVIVLTSALIDDLVRANRVDPDSVAALGRVHTGIAVREADTAPDVASPDALRDALLAAEAVYFPDPERATAGRHFAAVLERLGIASALAGRLRTFANGASAMSALAHAAEARPIGCTQVTEIRYTPGVALVGALPGDLDLATVYTVGVMRSAGARDAAGRLAAALSGEGSRALRAAGGFEPS
jgi:molybdate transport system substrate-binding protein